MKHRTDGYSPSGGVRRTRFSDTGLLSAFSGKLEQEKTAGFAGRFMNVANHTTDVSWVTDSDYLALIMFRYSASSSEARQALLLEKLELIRAGSASISGRPPRVIRSRMAAQSVSHRGQGTNTFRPFRTAITTQIHGNQLPENGNEHRLR
jgi:hypothetical protein